VVQWVKNQLKLVCKIDGTFPIFAERNWASNDSLLLLSDLKVVEFELDSFRELIGWVRSFRLNDSAWRKLRKIDGLTKLIIIVINFVLCDVESSRSLGQILPEWELCTDSEHFVKYALTNDWTWITFGRRSEFNGIDWDCVSDGNQFALQCIFDQLTQIHSAALSSTVWDIRNERQCQWIEILNMTNFTVQ
jgi:hypothetical protein